MTRCLEVDASWLVCCFSQMLPGTQALSASCVPSSLAHCHPLVWHLMVLRWELDLSWHSSCAVCQLRVTLFSQKATAFPEAPLSCLTSAQISLLRTGSQDHCQLECGQEKEGREGEAASQPDHLWDSQLGRLSGVHQTLGVTPEPAGSVSHASELAHAPCSSLSPDTGSDPPLVRALTYVFILLGFYIEWNCWV